jgi:O-antigen ligase
MLERAASTADPTRRAAARGEWLQAGLALLCAGVLAFYSGAWLVRDVVFGVSPAPQALLRFLGVPLALLGGVMILLQPLRALRLVSDHWAMALLILWAGLSMLWSVDRDVTVARTLAILLAFVAAVGLVVRFDARQLARITAIAALIGTGVSLLLLLSGDPLAESPIGVRGAFTHKNGLGQVAAIGALLGAGLALQRRDRILGLATMASSMACLALAQSATAVAATAAGLAALAGLGLLGSRKLPRFTKAALVLGGGLAALALGLSYTLILELLGRDPSLTNRDQVWDFTLDLWAKRPITGYGFRAFWTAPYNLGLVRAYFFDAFDQSHNGYLQILLDLGLIGLGLFLSWLFVVLLRATRGLADPYKRVWVVLWGAFMIYSFTEAIFLAPNGFTWFVVLLAALIITPIGARSGAGAAHA